MRSGFRPRACATAAAVSALVLAVAVPAPSARGEVLQWKSAADGLWSDGGNWDPGRRPGFDDSVLIDRTGLPYTVTWHAPDAVGGITIDSPDATLLGRGGAAALLSFTDLTVKRGAVVFDSIEPPGHFISTGSMTLEPGTTLSVERGVGGVPEFRGAPIRNRGTVNVNADVTLRGRSSRTRGC